MNRAWYYAQGSTPIGPVPEEQILALLNSRAIAPQTLIWTDGMGDWLPAQDLMQVTDPVGVPVSSAPPLPTPCAYDEPAQRKQAQAPADPSTLQSIAAMPQSPIDPPTAVTEPYPAIKVYGGIRRIGYWFGTLAMSAFWLFSSLSGDSGLAMFGSLVCLFFGFVLVVNRLHNIGRSGWYSLLILVPIVNLFVTVPCAICQEGYDDTKELDRAGRVLLLIFIVSLAVGGVAILVLMTASKN
ncbi:MAG TPA: GYF domain-containing protein [Verrucomicrobiae bacterium]|nr:GYF domain-containing protein [Verrucomicrobiae bacterium]